MPSEDARVSSAQVKYPSPAGSGEMRGLLAKPAGATRRLPGVVVVHENRGLNPYIEDVARRVALAGFVASAPDALYPLGGYPGNDDEGRTLQQKLDGLKITEDFVAAVKFLRVHPDCNGSLGVIGFCFGGAMANTLAWRLPDTIRRRLNSPGRARSTTSGRISADALGPDQAGQTAAAPETNCAGTCAPTGRSYLPLSA